MPRPSESRDLPTIPGIVSGLDPLAAGGQGEVFAGTWHDGRRVAVRIEPLHEGDRANERQRAEQEADLLRRLSHPNLVPLVAHGTTDATAYVVMEFVAGRDLATELARRGAREPTAPLASTVPRGSASAVTLPVAAQVTLAGAGGARPTQPTPDGFRTPEHCRWVASIGVQLCGALDRLHSAGFLHRDIKPRNVMVRADGSVVLVDLGLATAGDLPRVASDHSLAGTWGYMSPEQRDGRGISTRSDLYGLGCTLYECLTANCPQTVTLRGERLESVDPADVRTANPAVSETLALAIATCLRPNPGERYLTARDLGDDLLAVLAGKPLGWRRRPWSRRRALALASVTALGLASAAWWLARQDPGPLSDRVLAAVRGGDAEQATRLADGSPDRAALRDELRRRLDPTEVDAMRWFARAFGLGLVEVAAAPDGVVGACASDLEQGGHVEARYPMRTPLAIPVEPGLVKIVFGERNSPGPGPGQTDATLLVRLEGGQTWRVEPQRVAGARAAAGQVVEWIAMPTATRRIRFTRGAPDVGEVEFTPAAGLAFASRELTNGDARYYLEWVARDAANAALFAHPDEPASAFDAAAIERCRVQVREAPRRFPAQVSLWLAWRIAGSFGARLPTRAEWSYAAQMSYAADAAEAAASGLPCLPALDLQPLRSVDDPEPSGALGLFHLVTNSREWTCTPTATRAGFVCPVGRTSGTKGDWRNSRTGPINVPGYEDLLAPESPAGIRLVFTRD